jgi:hypothetical protein
VPPVRSRAASATAYPSTTHCRLLTFAPMALRMLGSAMLMTVTSSSTRKYPAVMIRRIRPLRESLSRPMVEPLLAFVHVYSSQRS